MEPVVSLKGLLEGLAEALEKAPPEPQALAEAGLRALLQGYGAQGGWVRLRHNGYRLYAYVGPKPPEEADLTPEEASRLARGEVLRYLLPKEATGPASRAWGEQGYRGLLLAPLLGREGLLGTLALLFRTPPPEGEALRALLPLFAIILERTQNEEALASREKLLEALHRLDRALLQDLPLERAAELGAEAARALTGARTATVSLLLEGRRRVVAASGEAVLPFVGAEAPLEEGPHGEALRRKAPVYLEIPEGDVPPWLLALRPLGSALVLPLEAGGEVLGFLSLYGVGQEALGPAQSLALQLALVLKREGDRALLRARLAEQEALLRALKALRGAKRPEEVAETLLRLATETLGADRGAVLLLEGEALRVRAASGAFAPFLGLALPRGRGLSWAALEAGTQRTPDAAQDPRAYAPEGAGRIPGPELATPLLDPHGKGLGVLLLGRGEGPFREEEARLAEALAEAGAAALLRAREARASDLLREGALLAAREEAPEALAQGFARLLQEAMGGGWVALFAHPEGSRPCRYLGGAGLPPEEETRLQEILPEAGGLAALALAQGEAEGEWPEGLPAAPTPEEREALRRLQPKALLVLPIGGFGVAYLAPEGGLGEEAKALFGRFLSLLVLAFARGRALLQERRVRQALEALSRVAPGALEGLVAALAQSLGVRWAFLDRLLGEDTAQVLAAYGAGATAYRLQGTPCAEAATRGFCEYPRELTRLFSEDDLARAMGAEAYLGAPLRGPGGQVLGLLVALHDRPLPPGEEGVRREVFLAYAQRAALELQHREDLHRLQTAAEVHALLRGAEDREALYARALEALLGRTRASTTNLFLYCPEEDVLEVVASRGYLAERALGRRLKRGEGISWKVLETGHPLYLPEVAQEPQAVFLGGERTRAAYAGAPLLDPKGRAFGVLSADTAARGGVLTPEDLHLLQAMAEALGAALARLEALEGARREAECFQRLAELSARLEALEAPRDLLEETLGALGSLSGFQAALYYALTPEGLALVALSGEAPEAWLSLERGRRHPPGEGPVGATLLGEIPYALRPPKDADPGPRAAAFAPILLQGRPKGALGVVDFREGPRPDPRPLLRYLAQRLARALERAALLAELRTSREEALKALGLALEYRDLESAGHTERVTALALRLGERVGLSQEALLALRLGAYLHDIGKLAIPDAILLKPGPLTPEEWERMKAHTTLGEAMARRLGFLPEATLEVIRHHYERFDGSGYPDGLQGEAIPFLARVFALADVYDALRSERPYKRAWSHEEALAEIARGAGRQFDPALAQAFLERMGYAG